MATLCKNCGNALIYDPTIGKMHCAQCGSTFTAEEVESEEKKYREEERVLSRDEVYGEGSEEAVEEFLECYVYTCSSCGGEIVIHGSETSTTCVYCGNPNVVFSRIAKEKMPDYIIPFTLSKEEALDMIRESMPRSIFIPKEVRHFKAEDVRGIYLPFWIVNANHEETCVIKSTVQSGKHSTTILSGRTGTMCIKNFPLDGCAILSNESSSRLEPFNMKLMRPFDEDYLLGFYSNASDISYDEMYEITEKRAREIFEEEVMGSVRGSSPKILAQSHQTAILTDYKYAMFPVWFVTFSYEGKHNTILVNGNTGKVVCGLPWRKALFWTLTILTGIILSVIGFYLFKGLFYVLVSSFSNSSSSNSDGRGKLIVLIAAGIVTLFTTAVKKMKKVFHQIKLTQSSETFSFVKKRQE
ncbi:MAG: hypothetical protein J5379_11120 [Clostridiales bacterium]|nr:hypothetical protein [Clostridiales bacterium]